MEIKNKINFRHLVILILSLLCLWEMGDMLSLNNAYAALIGLFVVMLPLAGGLLVISLAEKNKDQGRLRKISIGGIIISLFTFISSGLFTIYLFLSYYLS